MTIIRICDFFDYYTVYVRVKVEWEKRRKERSIFIMNNKHETSNTYYRVETDLIHLRHGWNRITKFEKFHVLIL